MCDLEYNDIDPAFVENLDVINQIEELYKGCFTGAHPSCVEELIRLGQDSVLARAFLMRVYLYGLQSTRKDGNRVKYLSKFVVPWAELHSLQHSPVSKYAQVIFADCHKKGVGVAIDLQRAFNLYKESAISLFPPALNNVGICYDQGEGVAKDKEEGMKWYRRAAELGYANAMDNLANALHDGEGIVDADVEALRWYTRAAELGYHRAINTLAGMYMEGDGVDENDEEAVRWLRRGVAYDSASSYYFLSFCYQHGRGVEVDMEESIRLLKVGADLGDEDAEFRYGAHLLYGLSVEDHERGRFFSRIYDPGYDHAVDASMWLLPPNEREGLAYLTAAANQRCGTACEYLAQYYFERHQDYISAYRWLRLGRHCRDNGAECMYLLGLLHFYGIVSTCCYNQRAPLTEEALQRVPAEPVNLWQSFSSPPPVWYPHDPCQRMTRDEEWRLAKRYFLLAREGQCYRASVYLLWLETQGDTVDLSIAQAVYSASSSVGIRGDGVLPPSSSTAPTELELDTDRYDREDAVRAAGSTPLDCQDILGSPLTAEGLEHGADDARYFQVAYQWLQALHTAAAAAEAAAQAAASSPSRSSSSPIPSASAFASSSSLEQLSTSSSPRGRGSYSSSPESLFFTGVPLPEKDIGHKLRSFRDHKIGRNFYTVYHHLAVHFAIPGSHQDMIQAIHYLEKFQRYFERSFPRSEDSSGGDHDGGGGGGHDDAWCRLRRVAHRRRQGRDAYQRYCQRIYGRAMTEEEAWRVDHSLLPVLQSDCLPLLDGLDGEAEGLCNLGLSYYYGLFYLSSQAKSPTEVAAAANIGKYWRLDHLSLSALGGGGLTTATKTAEQRQVELHRAIICFRRSAELGNARGQFCLGWCHRWGEGTHRDRVKAVEWFRASALQGYARAQFQLGLCYLKGKGVEEVSEEEGWRWIAAAAAQQYPEAVQYLHEYQQAASHSR